MNTSSIYVQPTQPTQPQTATTDKEPVYEVPPSDKFGLCYLKKMEESDNKVLGRRTIGFLLSKSPFPLTDGNPIFDCNRTEYLIRVNAEMTVESQPIFISYHFPFGQTHHEKAKPSKKDVINRFLLVVVK